MSDDPRELTGDDLRSNSGDARDAGAAPPAPPIVPPPRPGARQRQRARRVREKL